jgi:hypothetical protein
MTDLRNFRPLHLLSALGEGTWPDLHLAEVGGIFVVSPNEARAKIRQPVIMDGCVMTL